MTSAEESGPVSLSNNNIGNIINVDLDASAVVSANLENNILGVLVGYLSQQAALIGAGKQAALGDVASQDQH